LIVAFVGDASLGSNRVIIPRGSPEINSYARIILVNNEIEGATLINRIQEMGTISKLIEGNIDVSDHHAELADPNFDLKKLMGRS
jgi:NAD(P)H-nitrite reductase large subunit